jgi:hypothetical protein
VAAIRLVALQPLVYAGRVVSRGDLFTASPLEAAIFVRRQQARFARATDRVRPEPIAEPVRRRRQYRRRDLVAEP